MTPARAVAAVRAGWGAALLVAPAIEMDLERVLPERRTRAKRVVIRILGSRYLAQAGLESLRPHPTVLAGAALVDVIHAATDIALARVDPGWRRAAIGDAVIALAFATAIASARRRDRDTGGRA
jgi:hypothetical protein